MELLLTLCHVLQLASVQDANATADINPDDVMEVYSLLRKTCRVIKEIQKVLDLLELKIVKPSDTRWFAHEGCVKEVKASYSSILLALENIYETSHEPEALGLSKALSSHSTIASMYQLRYILPQVTRLSCAKLLLIHLMMLYCLPQIGFYSYKIQEKS